MFFVSPLLNLPRVIVGDLQTPMWATLPVSAAVTAGTYCVLRWRSNLDFGISVLDSLYVCLILVAVAICTMLTLSPYRTNTIDGILTPLWLLTISPTTTLLHGYGQV